MKIFILLLLSFVIGGLSLAQDSEVSNPTRKFNENLGNLTPVYNPNPDKYTSGAGLFVHGNSKCHTPSISNEEICYDFLFPQGSGSSSSNTGNSSGLNPDGTQ